MGIWQAVEAASNTFSCTSARCDSYNQGTTFSQSEAAWHTGVGSSQQRARLRGKEEGRRAETTHPKDPLLLEQRAHIHRPAVLCVLDEVDQLLVELAEEVLMAVELLE